MVKNSPASKETQVQSLSWEYPLEEEMATHCSIFAWRIPRAEEPGSLAGYSPWGCKESDATETTRYLCSRGTLRKQDCVLQVVVVLINCKYMPLPFKHWLTESYPLCCHPINQCAHPFLQRKAIILEFSMWFIMPLG